MIPLLEELNQMQLLLAFSWPYREYLWLWLVKVRRMHYCTQCVYSAGGKQLREEDIKAKKEKE